MADKGHRANTTGRKLDAAPQNTASPPAESSPANRSSRARPKSPRSRFTQEYEVMLELLIAARKDARVTQKEVAIHLGKTQSHVSMAEAKDREFSFVDIFRFCGAIQMEFSDFAKRVEEEIARRSTKSS